MGSNFVSKESKISLLLNQLVKTAPSLSMEKLSIKCHENKIKTLLWKKCAFSLKHLLSTFHSQQMHIKLQLESVRV